jgi:hypothetical protein
LHDIVEMNHALSVDRDVPDSPEMLNDVLERVERSAKHDALICVISDFFGADEKTEKALTRLGRHNDVICGLLYDPIKVDLPQAGRLVVAQGELQLELDTSSGRLRRDLGSFFDAELRGIRDRLQRVGVPTLMIQTAEDPLDQVRAQLGNAAPGRR